MLLQRICNWTLLCFGKHIQWGSKCLKKKCSLFSLYTDKDGDDLSPYQVCFNFQSAHRDKMSIRRWLVNFQLHEDSSKFPMFREMKKETYINMECKILYHTETAKDCCYIFVCDCTNIQPIVIHSNLEGKHKRSLSLQLEPLPFLGEILWTFLIVGSILKIAIAKGVLKSHFHPLNIGKWVKACFYP